MPRAAIRRRRRGERSRTCIVVGAMPRAWHCRSRFTASRSTMPGSTGQMICVPSESVVPMKRTAASASTPGAGDESDEEDDLEEEAGCEEGARQEGGGAGQEAGEERARGGAE